MKNSKGFTLIELLVVIAIIGILAGIVLVNVNSARNKGYDASIKAELSEIQNQAELFNSDNNGSYTGLFNDPKVKSLVDKLDSDNGSSNSVATSTTSDGTSYCVSSPLRSKSATIVCVDASGSVTVGSKKCSGGTCQ